MDVRMQVCVRINTHIHTHTCTHTHTHTHTHIQTHLAAAIETAEELAQQAFLDVIHLVDGGRERLDELGVDPRVLRELHCPLRHLLAVLLQAAVFTHLPLVHAQRLAQAPLFRPLVVNHVDVGAVHGLERLLLRLDTHGVRAVDPRHLHPVTRLGHIHQVLERAEAHSHGRLALGDILRVLLQTHHLLVLEKAAVVLQLERRALARLALGGLRDAAVDNVHLCVRVSVCVRHGAGGERAGLHSGYINNGPSSCACQYVRATEPARSTVSVFACTRA